MANRLLMFVRSAARGLFEGPVGSDLVGRAQILGHGCGAGVGRSLIPGPALELSPLP